MESGKAHRKFHLVRSLILIGLAGLMLGAAGCGGTAAPQRVMNVGMMLGSGGLGDRSFNDSAYAGLIKAQQKYNIRFETINYASPEANLESMRFLASSGYDLIICIGYEYADAIMTVAGEFPGVKFAAVDFEVRRDNIASIVYREQEGDFLMGVLAAMLTTTKQVGVIGGTDIPSIRRIMAGFTQGVTYQDSSVSVVSAFAGTFSDPDIGLRDATAMYASGVDVIHNAASRTGLGIIEAAKEAGKLETGTSGDQRDLAPGNVVGNRPKRVDTAVLIVIDELYRGSFEAGVRSLGLKENGLQLGPFDTSIVTPAMLDRLDTLQRQIIDGKIIIQDEQTATP